MGQILTIDATTGASSPVSGAREIVFRLFPEGNAVATTFESVGNPGAGVNLYSRQEDPDNVGQPLGGWPTQAAANFTVNGGEPQRVPHAVDAKTIWRLSIPADAVNFQMSVIGLPASVISIV